MTCKDKLTEFHPDFRRQWWWLHLQNISQHPEGKTPENSTKNISEVLTKGWINPKSSDKSVFILAFSHKCVSWLYPPPPSLPPPSKSKCVVASERERPPFTCGHCHQKFPDVPRAWRLKLFEKLLWIRQNLQIGARTRIYLLKILV